MYVSVTSSLDKGVIWFDADDFVALKQNVDKITGKHLSTNIYLSIGNESLSFNVIERPEKIIEILCS